MARIVRFAESGDFDRERALALLTPAELDRFGRSVRPEEFLQGRLLLREVAADAASLPVDEIVIEAVCPDCGGAHGVPTVAGADVHISLARASGALVAVASNSEAVGIDIEPLEGSDERERAVGALTGASSLRHWTRIEAVLKADGRGLRVDPGSVEIDGLAAVVGGRRYLLEDVRLDARYMVSIARLLPVA